MSVYFGQFKVDNRLEKLDDGSCKVGLDRETHRGTILNFNIKAGDGFAAFLTAHLNFKVKLV